MKEDLELSRRLGGIAEYLKPEKSEVSLAVINLKSSEPEISGYNMDHFIYPASIYKVFIAAEILRQVEVGKLNLNNEIEIRSPNEVDQDNPRLFPRSTHRDNRPLLKVGDRVTLDYLLDLMLTRSDNTAANVLMDIAGRENINAHTILENGWQGSEVTRKFLDRLKEEGEYRVSKITISNARHLVELFYKIQTNQLVSEKVSTRLRSYLLRWNKDRRKGLYLSMFKAYYRKGGWLEINKYKWKFWKGIKEAREKGHAIVRYSGDAGVVTGSNSHYAIAVLTLTKTKWPWEKFPITKLSREIYNLMETWK